MNFVFKSDRWCSCNTCLPQSSPAAQTTVKTVDAPGTGTDAPPVVQCLLTNTWPQSRQQHKHTSKQELILRNSTTIHKNSKQNQARTILRVSMTAWT